MHPITPVEQLACGLLVVFKTRMVITDGCSASAVLLHSPGLPLCVYTPQQWQTNNGFALYHYSVLPDNKAP